MPHDVFISYASEDACAAEPIRKILETQGIKCWIAPRDVPKGLEYAEAIIDTIRSSQVLVLIFSAQANACLTSIASIHHEL